MANQLALTSAGRLTISGVDVDVTGVAAGSIGKAEDAAHTSGDAGVFVLSRRIDAAASSAGTDADYAAINTDANGKLWVSGAFAEDAAHTTGDIGLAVLAKRTDTAAVSSGTDGDYSTINVDALGRLWTHGATKRGSFKVNPTVDTSAYGAGDIIGGIQTIANFALSTGGSGVLDSLTVYDADNEKAGFEIIFFDATPSGGTYADQGAPTWAAGDAAKCIGRVTVATGDYVTTGGDAIACLKNINLPLTVAATSLFALILATATPTYTAATDLHLVLGVRY
jgi:hypothetical protein